MMIKGTLELIETEDGPHGRHAGGHPLPKAPLDVEFPNEPKLLERFLCYTDEGALISPILTGTVRSMQLGDGEIRFRTNRSIYVLRPTPAGENSAA